MPYVIAAYNARHHRQYSIEREGTFLVEIRITPCKDALGSYADNSVQNVPAVSGFHQNHHPRDQRAGCHGRQFDCFA
jgi:hypothetical protein